MSVGLWITLGLLGVIAVAVAIAMRNARLMKLGYREGLFSRRKKDGASALPKAPRLPWRKKKEEEAPAPVEGEPKPAPEEAKPAEVIRFPRWRKSTRRRKNKA
jgi:hypothetical protein